MSDESFDVRNRALFADTTGYILNDAHAEKIHQFQLHKSIDRARKKPLLAGWHVVSTDCTRPERRELQGTIYPQLYRRRIYKLFTFAPGWQLINVTTPGVYLHSCGRMRRWIHAR